ncbi:inner-membrane translocator [Salinisphaera shabanensis T35B1]|uniref:Branched amino acid related transport system bifunctional protein Membrane n=1 Tax=Salinisphaera shabanensis E1L3A TaxID=1033802 RepID=U2E6I1_9GAMM|nr:branched-chain amino acid ABC transporter permease [Salinisphaera shabanensis]ERJ19376.1 Putative branched amino acid related transport system bifunctional protein Membrane [Salinisphaera shabanensis E1L3A]
MSQSQTARGALLWHIGIWALFALVIAVLPYIFTSSSSISMMSQMGVFIIFALSYNMLLGEAGMLSFGHAVYFGLGGFFTLHAIRAVNDGVWSFPLELMPLVGGAGGLAFGIIFGSISTRRAGVTFAMITLGIGSMVESSANMFTDFFGGESGISGNRVTDVTLFGFSYGPSVEVYYLIGAWTVIAAVAMYLLTKTPLGRISNAVRDNPERAQFVGYNTTIARFIQFSLSGFFAGIAGGLFAIMFEIMTAPNVGLVQSGAVLLMTFIGGVGVFFGPIIGAVLVTYMHTALSGFSEGWILYFGLLFVFMVMYAPGGIAGVLCVHAAPWRAGHLWRLLPGYLLALVPALLAIAGLVAVVEMGYQLSLAYDPSSPIDLFYMEVNATSLLSWLVALLVLAVGIAGVLGAARVVRARWAEVNRSMQASGAKT